MTGTREQVMAHIVGIYRDAQSQGGDGWKAVEAACPGIPAEVVAEAMVIVEGENVEAWWQPVEKTIDGEVISRALE